MERGKTTTRFGDLSAVFKNGDSPLLNQIGALCVLFEDLETENDAFLATKEIADHARQQQRQFYYCRRVLITLYEFRQRLDGICRDREFRLAIGNLPALHRKSIIDARRFLSKQDILRRCRNELGAHITPESIAAAIKYNGPGAYSSIGHRSSSEDFFLELSFANDLFRGAFASFLPGGVSEFETQIEEFMTKMLTGVRHAQHATFAIVIGLLWNRFGK
jgi:hypothetical protein